MTATDVARRDNGTAAQPSAALAIRPGQSQWDEFQVAALNQLGLAEASGGDRAVFLHQCQRTGLDPFARQIYCIGRKEKKNERRGNAWVETWSTKWTIQTGIDGWRVIRGRAEKREGVRCKLGRAIWYDADGTEYKVWVRPDPPVACEITLTVVDAAGDETPYTSVLMFREYVQTRDSNGQRVPVSQWATKPAHMLEKCTEADVYRKAFPQDFSGIDLDDAMPPPEAAPAAAARPVARAEIVRERPGRPTASRGAPTAQGGDSEASTGSRGEPDAPPADPMTAPARPTGAAMGKLGKLLQQVPLGDKEAVAAFLEWITGHSALEALTSDDVTTLTQYLTSALSAAQGNTEVAAGNIWDAWRAAHPEDAASEDGGQPGDGGTAHA